MGDCSSDFVKLAELLKSRTIVNSDSEDETEDRNDPNETIKVPTPGIIAQQNRKQNVYAKLENSSEQPRQSIENIDNEEVLYLDEDSKNSSDWKTTPQWEISYKQQVTASDIFLQMGNKGPSTASCEYALIKIHLPGENHQNIDLKVMTNRITLSSPKFKLDVPLPQPVDPKCGNAKWDKDSEQLVLTLKMNREFDYLNF